MSARAGASAIAALAPHPDGALDIPVLGPKRYARATLRALRRAARRADVVVAHGSSTLPACAAALLGARTPFVYVNIGDPRHWAGSGTRRLRVGAALHRAAAVAAISPGAVGVLRECFRLPERRLTVIPNARRADRFPPADPAGRRAAREALGLPPDGAVAAVVGALAPEKRVDLAVEAVARSEGVHLAVAGAGPLRERLEALAAESAPGRVTFLGNVDEPGTVYRAADVLLLSSDSEGVPGVLVEAALAAVPAAATDVGWVGDVVVDGRTGALAEPGDADALAAALERVLADREALGAAAREHALERFELSVVADAWQELLARVAHR
ncbi:hypothetical protein GCM10012280_55110 [Wenjunlia tyrosinilytica]|uniref:D-inositol 3-phosphate glycosyltransferase n=2 Tax=Wenjunlia tyrosinilytica TaxID=1544741 RepID=A0A917ZUQ1_9ACTN|nr:glycosyltransferase [Wenjunlia tyrosinilytica]GGO96186.1 hypothetical protein GCM10012280_55110 [Wenjunlia tyrosinilytica]